WSLVHFQSQPVPQRVPELLTEAALGDQPPGQRVGLGTGHSGPDPLAGPELRLLDQLVDRSLPVVRPAQHEGAGDIAAVAPDPGPEVDQQDVARLEDPFRGTRVWQGRARTRCDDRLERVPLTAANPELGLESRRDI